MVCSSLIDYAFEFLDTDVRVIRSKCNKNIFEEIKKAGIDIKGLLVKLNLSSSYYRNYMNGYSVFSLLQIKYILEYIYNYDKKNPNLDILKEVISSNWITSKIYETK